MVYVPYDYYNPKYKYIYGADGEILNPPGLTVLEYLKQQRKIKDLLNPLSMGERGDPSIGLWARCEDCGVVLYIKHLHENYDLCMNCGFHMKMSSSDRIKLLVDEGSWRPLFETMSSCDPLEFEDYEVYIERMVRCQKNTEMQDAIQTGTAFIDTIPIALAVMDFAFMGGSMGSVVGEKITLLIEYATQRGLPLVISCASGGARMQEGSLSLMQMAKISAALYHHQCCARLPYATILTSPTTGGVTASFGMLADFILTEPKSLIGFAGRRVIEATIGEVLPPNFQTAEYMMERGQIDIMVERTHIREVLSNLLWPSTHGYYKRYGFIPMGAQNGLTTITEEKLRRIWLKEYPDVISKTELKYPVLKESEKSENKERIENSRSSINVSSREEELPSGLEKGKQTEPIDMIQMDQSKIKSVTGKEITKTNSFFYSTQGLSYEDFSLEKIVDPKDIFTNRVVLKNRDEFPLGMLKDLQTISSAINGAKTSSRKGIENLGTGTAREKVSGIETFSPKGDTIGRDAISPLENGAVSNSTNRYFKKVENWFGELGSQKSYREILLSFESVFNMFTHEIAFREADKCEFIPFYFNYDRDSESKQFNVLDEAISFAKTQSIQWKAFYLGHSLPPKIEFFKNYAEGFSTSLETDDYEIGNENKFYYKVLLKKANLLERREGGGPPDPNRVENEILARKKAEAKAKLEADKLEAEIEENFQYVLKQNIKKRNSSKKKKKKWALETFGKLGTFPNMGNKIGK